MKKKVFVFSNLATSLDGKIATASREFFPLGTPYDRNLMQTLRKKSDVVVMGASTLREFRGFCGIRGQGKRQPANAVFSSRLEGIDPNWPFFQDARGEGRRFLFVSARCPESRIRKFAVFAQIVKLPARGSKADFAVRWLSTRGYSRILVEGGGAVMWDFCERNLIDRFYITLTPRILGGDAAPTLVDGKGFAPLNSLKLKLIQARRRADELYLIYGKIT